MSYLAGSTAAGADVKKGDRIVAIDGVSMAEKTSFEGSEQLQVCHKSPSSPRKETYSAPKKLFMAQKRDL